VVRGPGGIGKSALLARFLLDAAEPTLPEPLRFVYLPGDRLAPVLAEPGALQAETAAQLTDGRRPVLLVVDGADEAAPRAGIDVAVRAELDDLLSQFPWLRVVVTSRAEMDWPAADQLVLAELDHESATGLIAGLLGSADPALSSRIADVVGTSPLSLTLAAQVVAESGPDALRWVEDAVGQPVVEHLLGRLLDHIADPQVRRMLPAGLVLRRLTPEIIVDVLAEPLELGLAGLDDAEECFDSLRREVAIVAELRPDEVRFRADVRRVALRMVHRDLPVLTDRIHRLAVAHYAQLDDVRSRSEELYHRLALAEPEDVLDHRWVDGVAPELADALDELPAASQRYLRHRLGLEVEEIDELGPVVDALLADGRAEEALGLLRQRSEIDGGAVVADREVRALTMLGRLGEASEVAARGLDAEEDPIRFGRLALLAAGVEERRDALERALQWLRQGRIAVVDRHETILLLSIDTAVAQLARRAGKDFEAGARARQRLWEGLEVVASEELSNAPGLLRDLAGELGAEDPRLLRRALDVVGLPHAPPDAWGRLGDALEEWDRRIASRRGIRTVLEQHTGADAATSWRIWLRDGDRSIVDSTIGQLFDEYIVAPATVCQLLQRMFREASDVDHLDLRGSPIT
jgi:cellulose synthase operon protein C